MEITEVKIYPFDTTSYGGRTKAFAEITLGLDELGDQIEEAGRFLSKEQEKHKAAISLLLDM